MPVHGSIDLVYRDAAGWHVIDFKSDRLDGTSAEEAASHYAVQIGLYQRSLEAAVGAPASAALLFLRSGELAQPRTGRGRRGPRRGPRSRRRRRAT